jgi:hypothetical protein
LARRGLASFGKADKSSIIYQIRIFGAPIDFCRCDGSVNFVFAAVISKVFMIVGHFGNMHTQESVE